MTRTGWVMAAAASLLLHGAATWWFLPRPAGPAPGPETPAALEVELIDETAEQRGAVPGQPAPPPMQEQPPTPALPSGAASLPSPPPPVPPAPPRPPAWAAANLGVAEQDTEDLLVTGANVVPPRPDATFRNRPPSYPPDAARRGAQGTARLIVHVSEAGVPAGVDLAHSTGDTSLDRAALDAVALWRFQPARNNGVAVPFDYTLDITFRR